MFTLYSKGWMEHLTQDASHHQDYYFLNIYIYVYIFSREAQPKPSFATGILDGGWILCLKGLQQNWWVAGTPYLEPNSAQPITITQSIICCTGCFDNDAWWSQMKRMHTGSMAAAPLSQTNWNRFYSTLWGNTRFLFLTAVPFLGHARPYLSHLAFFSGGDMLPWGSCYARLLWRQSPSKARVFKACGKSCRRCGHVGAEHRTSAGVNQVVIDGVGCKTSGRWIFIWARIQLASRQPVIPSS